MQLSGKFCMGRLTEQDARARGEEGRVRKLARRGFRGGNAVSYCASLVGSVGIGLDCTLPARFPIAIAAMGRSAFGLERGR